ncbi:hypothetical protein EVC45_18745 [Paraburkholderia sp. UYCP14C]|nr:hypothetical protein EVC45_18745 [Paraburkholderia sp. UYCP14C]
MNARTILLSAARREITVGVSAAAMAARGERVKGRFRYPALECPDRHRGQPLGCAPATPPGMRVRTGRFGKLRS